MEGDSRSIDPSFHERVFVQLGRKWQHLMDKSTVHVYGRWTTSAVMLLLYILRIYLIRSHHIITYGLGIYLLNLLIGFLSPQFDPETEGPVLPSAQSAEFRPFSRRVPEFKFWYAATRALVMGICMTLFGLFDVPVFWPILLMYFILLFGMTMKRQIKHMLKYNYVPWTTGKQTYKGKGGAAKK